MTYKFSRYNIVLQGDKQYLWNTLSNYVVALDEDAYQYVSGLHPGDEVDLSSPYYSIMKKSGFAIKEEFDETGKVLHDYAKSVYASNGQEIYLTIAPGMGCNYQCIYCFEEGNRRNISMDEETCDAVIQYVSDRLNRSNNVRKLRVVWFGGEPLLYMDIIEKLSQSFISACENLGIHYSASIITNGRFLDIETAQKLALLQVKSAQISVDGCAELYCRNKLASQSDFDAVISHLSECWNILNIAVRINIYPEEYEEACKLTHYLLKEKELDGKIKTYIANKRNYSVTPAEEQSNFKAYCANDLKYRSMFTDGTYSRKSYQFRRVQRCDAPCKNICDSGACIGPKGELYKCEHHFGDQTKVVGSINKGYNYNNVFTQYTQPKLPKQECIQCAYLPCCMGGCPDDRINNRFIVDCQSFRERLSALKLWEIEQL